MTDTPYGFCHCGCGQKTAIATSTWPKWGHVKGEPKRYCRGHAGAKSRVQYIEEDRGYETPCWVWQRTKARGYGYMQIDGVRLSAHRHYYEKANGPIPDGLDLDHLCRVRACVNPDHLEPVTHQENVRRGLVGALKTTCRNGHPWIPENWRYDESDGHRRCRICRREQGQKRWREQQPLTSNQQTVLAVIADHGPVAPAEIGRATGLHDRAYGSALRGLGQRGIAERDVSGEWQIVRGPR